MDDGDVDTQPTLLDLAERQARAAERLLLLHQVLAFATLVGFVLWGIAALAA